MNTTKTESAEIREKRKRISRRYEIQGQIVAKSYVNWYHKRKKITEQKKSQMDNIEYQKYLRAYNFSYKFIDEDLDNEDIKFYESISDYNKELDEEYLKIE